MSKIPPTIPGYRYPGSRPFEDNEIDRCLFFGREKEKKSLFYKVLANRLTVLYARSGLGKTSLINAGLKQALRDKGYIPLMLRLNKPNSDSKNDDDMAPIKCLYRGIKEIVKQEHLDYEEGDEKTLWQYFKTVAFWTPEDTLLDPVLILDQFEEFFMLYSPKMRRLFIKQMADLVNNNIPAEVSNAVQQGKPFPYSDRPPNVKIIISIREDYLGYLDEMLADIPGILDYRYRLLPLDMDQARQAIVEPSRVKHELIKVHPFTFTPEAVDMMLDFLCRRNERGITIKADEVESFLLQVLCHHIEENKVQEKVRIGESDIIIESADLGGDKGLHQILVQFYENILDKFESEETRKRIRRLCEEGLIDSDIGVRKPQAEIKSRFNVSEGELAQLIDYRLIRSEPWGNSIYYELSHDRLVAPIRESQKKQEDLADLINKLSVEDFEKLALEYIKNGDLVKAVEIYRQIVNIDPECAYIYGNIADALLEKGENKLVEKIYGYAFRSGSKRTSLYLNLGYQYYKIKNYKAAAAAFQKALDLDPENISTKINLTENCFLAEEFEKAYALGKELSATTNTPAAEKLAAYFIAVSSLLFLGNKNEADAQLKIMDDFRESLHGNYEKSWNYQEIENFIQGNDKIPGTDTDRLLQYIRVPKPSKNDR